MEKPMNILVISDIHGNKEALQRIDKYVNKHIIDKIICLGDTVGYGTDFMWCLQWLADKNATILRGNHESMLIGETSNQKCSDIAKQSLTWAQKRLDENLIHKIERMPYTYESKDVLFTHAGDTNILTWKYINDIEQAEKSFAKPRKINFYGHTHRAEIIDSKGEKINLDKSCSVKLKSDEIYYINPGSVGQNRGHRTKVSFIRLELSENEIIIHYYCLKYNSYKAYSKVLDVGMDKKIGEYLIREKWRKLLYSKIYKFLVSKTYKHKE